MDREKWKRAERTEMVNEKGLSAQFFDHEGREIFLEVMVYHGKTHTGQAVRVVGIAENRTVARVRVLKAMERQESEASASV